MLAEMQARNLFLSGLDRSRTWFRYHHLFADYLRGRGRERPGDAARAICLRASDWFQRHRLPHEAVRYAFDGQDLERAADLVADFSAELVQHRGEHATLLAWLTRLPQALVHARPKIRTGHAWSLVLTRRYAGGRAGTARAGKRLRRTSGDDDAALRGRDDPLRLLGAHRPAPAGQVARARPGSSPGPRANAFRTGVVANVLASGCCASDAFEQGLQALAIARRAFEECDAHYGLAWASALAMMIAMRRGDFNDAMAAGPARHRRRSSAAWASPRMRARCSTLLAAEVCYEQGELAQAQRFSTSACPSSTSTAWSR